jgi:endonuclease/exonuclease/phosphatase family metal-dependent hydrolase
MGENALHASRLPEWPSNSQYEFLADSLWHQHAYGRNAAYPHGHHGNALLSMYPILDECNHDISVQGHEERGMLHCVLDVPGSALPLHTVCVHLGLRDSHRRRQLRLLCDLLHDGVPADAPLVVAGDFNDWRRRGHATVLDCGMHEAFERHRGRVAKTFPARHPMLPLDRIYLRNAEAAEPRVLSLRPWTHLSDHAPLHARIGW